MRLVKCKNEDLVFAQVWIQVRNQLRKEVWDQVRDQTHDQVLKQVWNQVSIKVRAQVYDQVQALVWDPVINQLDVEPRDLILYEAQDKYIFICVSNVR